MHVIDISQVKASVIDQDALASAIQRRRILSVGTNVQICPVSPSLAFGRS